MSEWRSVAAALLFASALPSLLWAADTAISVGGHVQHPLTLTADDLKKLPATTIQATFLTDKGPMTGSYTGALLWTVIGNAVPADDPGKNAYLRHGYLVTGSDSYAVLVSQGEIDPRYEGKDVVLAYAKDGKPLDAGEGIRLVIPGDHHGGRAVRDVASIEVR
jgi:DMSO/TMAO reductase YedYZ molybdopterin-dependent catalytic subunit